MLVADWPAPAGVKTLITSKQTRLPDLPPILSTEPFGFNVAVHVNDVRERVEQRRAALQHFVQAKLVWIEQVHGTDLLDRDLEVRPSSLIYDGAFSFRKNRACVISTADCLPIFLCDEQARFVAAVHAGWKGLYEDIIANAVKTITKRARELGFSLKAEQLLAYIGPCIRQSHYQVDDVFFERFVTRQRSFEQAFIPCQNSSQHYQADLPAIAMMQLRHEGVTQITDSKICTFSDARFYSFRRQPDCGRFASMIWLE